MSDDLAARLNEASRHFAAQSYDACAKVLASCPHHDTDPKIKHNAAVVDFSRGGFQHTLQTLSGLKLSTAAAASTAAASSSSANNSNTSPTKMSQDSVSWEFDGQDVMKFNEGVLRAHIGELDAAHDTLMQLLQSRAPVSTRVQVRAAALAFVIRRSIVQRPSSQGPSSPIAARISNAAASASGTFGGSEVSEKALQELLNSAAFKELSAADQKELKSVVAAAAASDLPSLQAWLKEHASSKDAGDAAVMLNNAGVQLLFSGDVATAAQLLTQAVSAANDAAAAAAASSSNNNNNSSSSSSSTSSSSSGVPSMQAATIRFNLALALFAAGNYQGAIASFAPLQGVMADSAVFWFRLGQALSALATEQAEAAAKSRLGKELLKRAHGLHEHGMRPHSAAVVVPIATEALIGAPGTDGVNCPQIFALADTALQNAYVLLLGNSNSGSGSSASSSLSGGDNNSNNNTSCASVVSSASTGTQELMQSLLTHMTYVSLSRGNPQAAAKYVMDYFGVRCAAWTQNRDITCTMLCYAVEALCSTQRAGAALKLLQSHDLGELILSPTGNSDAAGPLDSAYTDALLVNVCLAQLMNGNWQKACSIGQNLLPRLYSRNSNAVLLGAYVELARGSREKALEIFEKTPLREPV